MTNAAAATGFVDPAQALVPDLLREAARTLAAVAEENVERENGFYAGDRARFLARLDVAPAPRPATRESMVVRARVAQESPPESTWIGAGSVVAEPVLFVRGGSAIDSPNGADLAARAFAEAGAFPGRPQPIDPVRPTSLASKQSSTRSA